MGYTKPCIRLIFNTYKHIYNICCNTSFAVVIFSSLPHLTFYYLYITSQDTQLHRQYVDCRYNQISDFRTEGDTNLRMVASQWNFVAGTYNY